MIPLGLLDGDNGPSWSVTGGTITSDGTYYYHTFDTTSGELVVEGRDVPIEYLLVGTGGSGGGESTFWRTEGSASYSVGPGGGGAGGVLTGSTVLAPGTYPITIGAPKYITEGAVADTTAFGLTAFGGGHGAISDAVDGYALSGGSGGGGAMDVGPFIEYAYAGYGEPGQGNDGGNAQRTSGGSVHGGGGGGGAGAVGQTSTVTGDYVPGDGANGGAGIQVWGDWYAAGGGGFPATKVQLDPTYGFPTGFFYGAPGFGGTGGGGISGTHGEDSATPPTTPGSGGGGCNLNNGSNHWGAMGIVRIRYRVDDEPSAPPEVAGDFEAIASVTVGSGGASSIEFTSIPSTFAHLQVRFIARTNNTNANQSMRMYLNGNTTNTNYAYHRLYGNGSIAGGLGVANSSFNIVIDRAAAGGAPASTFGAGVIDILDYANTSKNTTTRSFGGVDVNGSGDLWVTSGLFAQTAAVSSIYLEPYGGTDNFVEHTTAALYGIKGGA